jgi:hypothetical protein
MGKKTDASEMTILKLLSERRISDIRQAIISKGKVNVRKVGNYFNIVDGNSYFRQFINSGNLNIGLKAFSKIIDTFNYKLIVVPVKKDDIESIKILDDIQQQSYTDICNSIKEELPDNCVKKDNTYIRKKKESQHINLIENTFYIDINETEVNKQDESISDIEVTDGFSI